MDIETATILCELNNGFYREHSASFAATREHPWHGWQNLEILEGLYAGNPSASAGNDPDNTDADTNADAVDVSVFDLACGNLRFEAFVQTFIRSRLPNAQLAFYGVDNCGALLPQAPDAPAVRYQNLDILSVLQQGLCLSKQLSAPLCDLAVSFGFMHHVPLREWREEILRCLVKQTRPGGYVVVSFWQFLNSAALEKKAQATHKKALEELDLPELDSGDYLLGWQDRPGAYRYCHSFADAEIDQIVAAVSGAATVISRFLADGKTNNLNTYLVLQT